MDKTLEQQDFELLMERVNKNSKLLIILYLLKGGSISYTKMRHMVSEKKDKFKTLLAILEPFDVIANYQSQALSLTLKGYRFLRWYED